MLFADTFRGPDSTGVAVVGASKSTQIYKEAIAGPDYITTKQWGDLKEKAIKDKATCLIGHNRWATMGAVNNKNAHPFRIGDITLVHNGTLTDQALLPDWRDFDVDSENICHSINKIGAAETIQKLDGAFTLIWHDQKDQTVHIVRNSKRPFHLARTSTGDWYGASEEAMLMWILKRGKYSPTISEHFEVPVGEELIFNSKMKLVERVKHELPVFTYQRYSTATTKYDATSTPWSDSTSKSGKHAAKEKASRDALIKHNVGYSLGEEINFLGYDFKAYKGSSNLGTLIAYPTAVIDNVTIKWFGAPADQFDYAKEFKAKISSAREDGDTCIISVDPRTVREVGAEPETKRLTNGRVVTKQQWEGDNACGWCDQEIPWEKADKVEYWGGTPLCHLCNLQYTTAY